MFPERTSLLPFLMYTTLIDSAMKSSLKAGVAGAVAGIFGKLASEREVAGIPLVLKHCRLDAGADDFACNWMPVGIQITCLLCMLGMNTLMFRYFLSALQESDSLTSTISSFSTNFVVTAIGGFWLFHEDLNIQWTFGAIVILLGMFLLIYGESGSGKGENRKQ
uniref:AlNc14C26G2561 protein n=1 Tax=Albugo laibachii Nc14 TaxID=890382 RepID=F0W6S5_9STRA|nr:AlNc14C26G2561 [Albugo laibachii Nc14]|eukprot:CCA16820.1 AlNc14C26G2561 [Albugo laibachii Nc14]